VKSAEHHLEHETEYILMALSTVLVLASIVFAWFKFKNYEHKKEATGLARILLNKWYVDEIYQAVIVNPISSISSFFDRIVEKKGIDGLVNGVGKAVNYGSRQLRLIQNGQVGVYVLLMVIGMLVLFIIQLFA
jgi:NADH-quinone oxidoreductase subunit L